MDVVSLHLYPVKSLRGLSVPEVTVDALGIVGDRRFLVINSAGVGLTQRSHPQMALIDARLTATDLILSRTTMGSVRVPWQPQPGAAVRPTKIFSTEGLLAEDCGEEAAQWLAETMGEPCRLVRIGPAFARPLKPSKAVSGDVIAYTDAYPFMVVSEASLMDLNDRLVSQGEAAVPIERFRPSLVIRGAKPFEEDTWQAVEIGPIRFRAGGPCARCLVTTTDPLTGVRGHEPLRTLARYRRDAEEPAKINFGQNLIHETKSGAIRLGDRVVPVG
jgi:uncharacterized protein YcbX